MPNLRSLIKRTIPEPAERLMRQAGSISAANPTTYQGVYLVGGPVRDMLLGKAPGDLDFTVVGDAVRFAKVVAKETDGQVIATSEFGTAKVSAGGYVIDIATARSETYAQPGALPEVSPAGIDDDLKRRDFSVNAMAMNIGPERWGDLLDRHGGMADVTMRRLRVLHEQSFVDDPTRLLRAVRYEVKLGFTLAPRTMELLERDSGYLDEVSPARVRHELERILAEPMRADMLRRAEDLGLLAAISPALRINARALDLMARDEDRATPRPLLYYIALIGANLTHDEAETLIRRLDPPREWTEALLAGPKYRDVARVLEGDGLKASDVAELLSAFPLDAMEVQLELAPPTRQKEWLQLWLTDLRFRRPSLTGDDLLAEGVPQGPIIGRILNELQIAVLDRTAQTRQDELDLVRRRLPVLLSQQQAAATYPPAGAHHPC